MLADAAFVCRQVHCTSSWHAIALSRQQLLYVPKTAILQHSKSHADVAHCYAVKSMYASGDAAEPRALEDVDGIMKKFLPSARLQMGKDNVLIEE